MQLHELEDKCMPCSSILMMVSGKKCARGYFGHVQSYPNYQVKPGYIAEPITISIYTKDEQ